jgi:hypothetical protein
MSPSLSRVRFSYIRCVCAEDASSKFLEYLLTVGQTVRCHIPEHMFLGVFRCPLVKSTGALVCLLTYGIVVTRPNLCQEPPLWSSGQGSWLQIQRPGFDSRHYQIF